MNENRPLGDDGQASAPAKYWFPAKADGMGWGFPTAWQGRVVFAAYVGLMVGLAQVVTWTVGFVGIAFVLTGLFVAICWWKGERRPSRDGRRLQ